MKKYTMFYAGMIHMETDDIREMRITEIGYEIYNGCYIYGRDEKPTCWFRGDLTPCLMEDVPKELRALMLILT